MNIRSRYSPQQKQENISRKQFGELLESHGFITSDISPDMGEDFLVRIYDEHGVSTGLSFYAQLKSVSDISDYLSKTGDIRYPFKVKDLEHWYAQAVTVILVVWDITTKRGWWIWINHAIQSLDKKNPEWRQKTTAHIHIPGGNALNEAGLYEIRHLLANLYMQIVSKGQGLIINARFSFPQTVEGKAKFEELQRHFSAGDDVEITGEYIEAFALPDWWNRLYGEIDLPSMYLKMGSTRSPDARPVRLEFISQTQSEQIPYVELWAIKQGKDEITLSNDRQNIPLKLSIIINIPSKQHTINISANLPGKNCVEILQILNIQQIVCDGGHIKFTLLSTGDVATLPIDSHSLVPPDKILVDFVNRLSIIQNSLGIPLNFSADGTLKVEDYKTAEELSSLIESGHYRRSGITFTINILKPGIQFLLDRPSQASPVYFQMTYDKSSFEILSQTIELGPIVQKIRGYWDMPIEEVKHWFDTAQDTDTMLVRLVNAELYEEFVRG